MDSKVFAVIALCLAAVIFNPVSSPAEEPPKDECGRGRIEELEHRISGLEDRVGESDRAMGRIREALGSRFGFNLGLFGDANFMTDSRENENGNFHIGNVDLYSTGHYGERLTFLTEVVIEVEEDGYEIDVERLWAGYSFSDFLNVRAGKQHVALGHWNHAYHHGTHLFESTHRPFFMDFEDEGGILPAHITGAEATGRWSDGFAMYHYDLQIGNGPRIDTANKELVPNDASDDNASKQVAFKISLMPRAFAHSHLNIGLSGTTFKINTPTKRGLRENIYAADAEVTFKGANFAAEYFRLQNSFGSADAFYVQLTYKIGEKFTPYARYESLDVGADDPYTGSLRGGFDRRQIIAGIRYDIEVESTSIKAEYRLDDVRDGRDFNVFEVQWSFAF